jgi:hypothetical protein
MPFTRRFRRLRLQPDKIVRVYKGVVGCRTIKGGNSCEAGEPIH